LNYPEKHIKEKAMKNLNFESAAELLNEFALTNEEMIYVRGGESDPISKPVTPPIKI
jgi:hypothetical protein